MIDVVDVRSGEILSCDNSTNRTIIKFLVQNDFLKDILNYKVAHKQVIEYHDFLFNDDLKFYGHIVRSLNKQLFTDKHSINVVDLFDSYFYNKFRQVKRVKDFIEDKIVSGIDILHQAYFITLTLVDTYTADDITVEEYKYIRTKVRKFIAKYSNVYVFNKDYGVDDRYTKRLHFHGVALMTVENKNKFEEKYSDKFGFLKIDLIDEHSDYISKYINKLSYHALKVNTGAKRECLIYSR